MEKRIPGSNPLYETRAEGNEKVDRKKRYHQIIEILSEHEEGLTAKEIAVYMKEKKYAVTNERNLSAPRLTEMLKFGIVDCIGKKVCEYTGVSVGVFKLREGIKNVENN